MRCYGRKQIIGYTGDEHKKLKVNERNANMEVFEKVVLTIQSYFSGKDILQLFLHGGCYWLAMTLHQYIPDSAIVFNRKMQHCASLFNDGVYDIRGRIPSSGFRIATTEDIKYMQKHFIPDFDADDLKTYLDIIMYGNGKEE